MPTRQPIVCILGHVDTGKTLLLDKIRKSTVQAREAGGITQHIGASFFPLDTLREICGPLLRSLKVKVKIPGLLIIDTPGHEAFANLRKRGGAVADIAILVIDVLKGFEPQTHESLEILRTRKTPFLVAINKIDRIPGWAPHDTGSYIQLYRSQAPSVREDLDNRLYTVMGTFSSLGYPSERFDRIQDFTKTIALVPTSAKTGEGVPELLSVLVGLTQQFLQRKLQVTKGPGKGTVLEVKDEPGLGMTINAIVYDGMLQKGDTIVVGGKEQPVVTKTRALLLPKALDEIRDPRDKFSSVRSVTAASGVKIVAPSLELALPGAPLYAATSEKSIPDLVKIVAEEVESIKISTDIDGVVLKTDTLGSLEAIATSLNRENVPIRLADVGDVSKRDVTEANVVKEHEPLLGSILAFNVRVLPDAEVEASDRGIRIFQGNIIYNLIDNFVEWMQNKSERLAHETMDRLVKPGKIHVLPGYIFRKAKPAVVGVEVIAGRIRPRINLVREDGEDVGVIQQIQDRGNPVSEATVGMQVAVSLDRPIVGRHIHEDDILHASIPEAHVKVWMTQFVKHLTTEERSALEELVEIKRKKSPFWAT
ncbi:MAG: translation initiation factor IF-2 [Candidatus Bathyarchaeota archaeon]|nr:MAG: translation initiation factor IF-2 [Candidatus Bathyarchaeota archaeon]